MLENISFTVTKKRIDIYVKFNRNGNIKLGDTIATFNKLYSDETFTTKYGSVTGSCKPEFCSGCKAFCYVRKSYRYGSVINGHARNTLAMRENIEQSFNELYSIIKRARKAYKTVRIHQSGELESMLEFMYWCKLADACEDVEFYVYTKAFPFVIPVLLAGLVPLNLIVNLSIWHEYGIEEYNRVKHLENVKAFVYVDHSGFDYEKHGLDIQTWCNAYDENGNMNHAITCDKCRKCIDKNPKHKIIGCWDH